jgi:hypothetical protein
MWCVFPSRGLPWSTLSDARRRHYISYQEKEILDGRCRHRRQILGSVCFSDHSENEASSPAKLGPLCSSMFLFNGALYYIHYIIRIFRSLL